MRKNRLLSLLMAAAMMAMAALTLSSCKSDENNENSEKPAPSKYDVTGTWMAEVEAAGTVGGGGQMTYDHLVTACKFNSDGSGTWYRFMLTNDSGNPVAVDGGAGHGDFTYSVSDDGKIACRLTGSQAPAYYPASLSLTLSGDTIAGREGDVAYKMSRASDAMARWIANWDQRLHGGGNSDATTGDIVDLSTLTGDMEARNGQTLTGTLGCYVKISIADGATVTLRDATISGRNKNSFRWAGITCPGNATLVLEGANSVRGFQRMYPGIHIAQGKTLTIQGSGSLDAGSNGYGAAIGGGSSIDCGSIVIEGGTITAEGGSEAAAIGGGGYAACGNITITSDVTSLTAIKGDGAKHSIGAGADGSCGTVKVGGKEGAISADTFIYPADTPVTGMTLSNTEASLAVGETVKLTVTFTPDYAADKVTWSSSDEAVATVKDGVVTAKAAGKATITVTTVGGKKATCTVYVNYILTTGVTLSKTKATLLVGETLTLTATVAPSNATNKSVTWSSSNNAVVTVSDGVVTAKADGTATITVTTDDGKNTATCTVSVYGDSDKYIVDLSKLTEDYTAHDGDILIGTLGKSVKVSIASGATVRLRNATINGVNSAAYPWAGINPQGDATIVLEGTNSVRGFLDDYPGIHIPQGKTLTIKGSGSLNASSNAPFGGAGIGGGYKVNCGNIVIEGGTVNAVGRHTSPGIGGGILGSCGTITITDGVTSVTATKGGYASYSIGPGDHGTCGTITIGGKVTGPISESPYTYKP